MRRAKEGFSRHERLVVKPLYGARGEGVVLCSSPEEAYAHEQELGRPCLLQELVPSARCLRALTTRRGVVALYEKRMEPEEFVVANVARGAERVSVFDPRAAGLALAMLEAVSGDIGGVDILVDAADRYWALEVNLGFGFELEDERVGEAFVALVEEKALSH
jgi:glutathione synthase/RimK-type ligase-like ATP-grasp enzyme